MKPWKKVLVWVLACMILFAPLQSVTVPGGILVAEAHSGRTDSSGGHRDNRNASGLGYYHYHCGGHPAHLHTNGVCPYAAGSGSSGSKSTGTKTTVRLNKKTATITEGKTLQLKISGTKQKVKWTSSKKSVASVSSKGKVTARKPGKATITATVGGKKYKCKITVRKKPELTFQTVDYWEYDAYICFRIKNNTKQSVVISGNLQVFDGDYTYFTDMQMAEAPLVIAPGKTAEAVFYDTSEDQDTLYYAQQFVLIANIGGIDRMCIGQYTGDDGRPYSFKIQ